MTDEIEDNDAARSAAAAVLGRKGGASRSKAKVKASAQNALNMGLANRGRSSKAWKRARLANLAKARAARALTIEQIQKNAIEKLLAIREPGPYASGHVQPRMRAAARKAYARSARRLGYNVEQIAEQWKQINESVEIRRMFENERKDAN